MATNEAINADSLFCRDCGGPSLTAPVWRGVRTQLCKEASRFHRIIVKISGEIGGDSVSVAACQLTESHRGAGGHPVVVP